MSGTNNRYLQVLFCLCLGSFFFGIAVHQAVVFIFLLIHVFRFFRHREPFGRVYEGQRQATSLLAAILVSALFSTYAYYQGAGEISFHWAFLTFWIFDRELLKGLDWTLILKVLLVCALPGMLRSVLWLFQPDEIRWALKVGFQHYPRSFGFNGNPIVHAEGLLITVFWVLASLTGLDLGKWKKAAYAFIVFVLILITLSRVRSAWVAFLVISLVHAWTYKAHRKAMILLVGGMLLGAFGTFFLFGFNFESITERWELIQRGLTLFFKHPLLGIGPDRFPQYSPIANGLYSHPHNTIVAIAAETGVIGLICFLWFSLTMFKRITWLFFQGRKGDSPLGTVPVWVLRGLWYTNISFWVFGLTDYNFGSTQLLLIYTMFWGILARLPISPSGEVRS